MDDIGPFQFVAVRFIIAGIVVAPFAIHEIKKYKIDKNTKKQMILVGIIFFTSMILQQIALLGTNVTNTGMLTGLYVLFVPAIAIIFYQQKQPVYIIPCAILAFAGTYMLAGNNIKEIKWGDMLAIACAMFWAWHVIIIGQAVRKTKMPITIATTQFFICGIIAAIGFGIARGIEWEYETELNTTSLVNAMPEILFAAVLAGGVAFTLQAVAQRYTKATVAAVILSAEALVAAVAGAIILNERLSGLGYLGCACLFIAIATTSYVSAKNEKN